MAKKRMDLGTEASGSPISWFSCGAASYVTSKLALRENTDTELVYIDVGWEHEDNHRFLQDAERVLGVKVKIIKNPNFANPAEVFLKGRFLSTVYGAPCTGELKKSVRQNYETGLELQYFGFDASEVKRRDRFLQSNQEQAHLFRFPLIEQGYTKEMCLAEMEKDGILPPITYRMGYKNANCIGCVKGGKGYWKKIRGDFPERFEEMAQIEEKLGYTIFRQPIHKGAKEKKPIPLREINWDKVKDQKGLSWECGILCINEGDPDFVDMYEVEANEEVEVETLPPPKQRDIPVQIDLEEYLTEGYIPPPPQTKRKKTKFKQSTGKEEWHTPPYILEAVREYLGGTIDLDPMSNEKANEYVKATTFYTKSDDAFTKPWFGNVFLNPPYKTAMMNRVIPFIIEKCKNGEVESLFLLVNNSTESKWGQVALKNASAICFIDHRLRFIDGETGELQGTPFQGQMLVLFNGKGTYSEANIRRFCDTFSKLGVVIL